MTYQKEDRIRIKLSDVINSGKVARDDTLAVLKDLDGQTGTILGSTEEYFYNLYGPSIDAFVARRSARRAGIDYFINLDYTDRTVAVSENILVSMAEDPEVKQLEELFALELEGGTTDDRDDAGDAGAGTDPGSQEGDSAGE